MAKFFDGVLWYTPEEIAEMVGTTGDYIRELARGRRGKTLPGRKEGRQWFFHKETVIEKLGIRTPKIKKEIGADDISRRFGV